MAAFGAELSRGAPYPLRRAGVPAEVGSWLVACWLLLASGCVGSSAPLDRERAWRAVRGSLDASQSQSVVVYGARAPVAAGEQVRSWGRVIRAPETFRRAWLFFIDEAPAANWEHACRYVFVDLDSGAVATVPGRTPPDELAAMDRLPSGPGRKGALP